MEEGTDYRLEDAIIVFVNVTVIIISFFLRSSSLHSANKKRVSSHSVSLRYRKYSATASSVPVPIFRPRATWLHLPRWPFRTLFFLAVVWRGTTGRSSPACPSSLIGGAHGQSSVIGFSLMGPSGQSNNVTCFIMRFGV